MTKDQLEKIKHLVSLFEERDKLHQQSTEKILEAVGSTALEALFTLFGVPYEKVTWLETQLVENIVLLVASISYDENQTVPPMIQAMSPMPVDGRPSLRLFRVGLPLDLIFQPKDDIVEYLVQTVNGANEHRAKKRKGAKTKEETIEDNSVPVHVPQREFDTSQLTHDQIQQLLIFDGETKGIKH